MMVADQEMDALLKRLHLANTRREWRELARRAEQEGWTYHDFLALLVTEEIAHRQQTRLERVVRRGSRSSRRLMTSISCINQRCDSRSSDPRCRPTSRRKDTV